MQIGDTIRDTRTGQVGTVRWTDARYYGGKIIPTCYVTMRSGTAYEADQRHLETVEEAQA